MVEITSGILQGYCVVWLPLEIALIFSRLHQLPDGAAPHHAYRRAPRRSARIRGDRGNTGIPLGGLLDMNIPV
ncbi:MAG: hypothetical protein ABWX69_06505 [Arthrobacter sp.]